MAGGKVADLDQIFERIGRDDIAEISLFSKHPGVHIWRGALIGAIVGAVTGAILLHSSEEGSSADGAPFGAFFGAANGTAIGAIVGGVAPRTPDVIYRGR